VIESKINSGKDNEERMIRSNVSIIQVTIFKNQDQVVLHRGFWASIVVSAE
jgi:hypothetical protein